MKWSSHADRRVVEAVIASFRDSADRAWDRLCNFSDRDWERSYYWLDASGLALYFLDHVTKLGIEGALPGTVLSRLQQNHADNKLRSAWLFGEFAAINHSFQEAGIVYANLKGFSLSPESCPDPTLRCQLDLDFLVDGRYLKLCQSILAESGYKLTAATETTWEFKAGSSELVRMEDHYKVKPQRSVELHFASTSHRVGAPIRDERLDRLAHRTWNGVTFPALSDGDLFVGQALHVFGHLRGASTRLAWLLEYRQHVLARRNDERFWDEVLERSARHPQASIGIGLVTLLTSQIFGINSPSGLDSWTLESLPASVGRWAEMYGRQALLADFPGTKLYMILEDQLALNDGSWRAKRRRSLMPLHRAPRIVDAGPSDTFWKLLRRESYQIHFVLFRLRFHLVEGLRYLRESRRWKKQMDCTRDRRPVGVSKESILTKG
jgi:hypothetical protein